MIEEDMGTQFFKGKKEKNGNGENPQTLTKFAAWEAPCMDSIFYEVALIR